MNAKLNAALEVIQDNDLDDDDDENVSQQEEEVAVGVDGGAEHGGDSARRDGGQTAG